MIHKYNLRGYYILLDINSGSVFEIDKITYKILDFYPKVDKEQTIKQLTGEFKIEDLEKAMSELDYLVSEGILFSDDIDFDEKLNLSEDIKAMCLHVSHDCNIRCEYCFAAQGNFHGESMLMDLETGKKAIDFLIENSGIRHNLEIDFFGGEPLMNLDVVKGLVDYARSREKGSSKHFRFTMTTNGVLLDDENMEYLNENMSNIVLSIDGRKEINDRMRKTVNDKGTYDLIIHKFKKMAALRKNKDYYVRGTFTRNNLDFSKDVLDLADQGFGSISVEPVVAKPDNDYALTEEDMDMLLQEYENLADSYITYSKVGKGFNFFHFNVDLNQGPCAYKRASGCGAGTDYIAVTPTGEIYPCHQFVGNEAFLMGHVKKGIEKNEIREAFKVTNLTEKKVCRDCWAKYYCGGGCFANAFNFNDDISVPYEIGCTLEKKRIECAIMLNIAN